MRGKNEVSEIYNKNIFCSRSKPDRLFNMPNTHYHNHYEIYYLISGKRKYFIENKIYKVNTGDIIFIPKGDVHRTITTDNSYHQRLLISFNDQMIFSEYIKEIDACFSRHHYSITKALLGRLELILFKIEEEYKKDDKFSEQIIKGCLLELFSFFIREENRLLPQPSSDPQDNDISLIVAYLGENYNSEITLSGIAKLFNISVEHLSRKFKKNTGFNFSEYLTLIRIYQAEKLLQNGKLSITEIASQTGFNDGNYFSSVFKKIKGVPPNTFRKSL